MTTPEISCAQPAPCGHPESLTLKSAETGEPLYCEACDDKSGRHDAEDRETAYAVEIGRLRNVIQAACIGGTDLMIERWKQWFPDAPVPTVHAASEPTRSQRMRDAGYTRRPSWKSLPSDADDEAIPAPEGAQADSLAGRRKAYQALMDDYLVVWNERNELKEQLAAAQAPAEGDNRVRSSQMAKGQPQGATPGVTPGTEAGCCTPTCGEAERLRTALRQIAAFRPLTFAECSDAEAVIGIAEKALDAPPNVQPKGTACAYPECDGDEPARGECCKRPASGLPEYTSAMGEAAQAYIRSLCGPNWNTNALPATFRWSDCWDAMCKVVVQAPAPGHGLPTGWLFRRNTDGSIGIHGPAPKPGESQRTSDAVHPSQSRDLHELLGRLADHQASAPSPAVTPDAARYQFLRSETPEAHALLVELVRRRELVESLFDAAVDAAMASRPPVQGSQP